LAQFIVLFPRPEVLKESRYKTKFAHEAIEKKKLEEEKEGDRTIIGNIMHAVDPETGAKFSPNDILTNSNFFMYSPDVGWVSRTLESLHPIPRLLLSPLLLIICWQSGDVGIGFVRRFDRYSTRQRRLLRLESPLSLTWMRLYMKVFTTFMRWG
jgi:hypothetical protein